MRRLAAAAAAAIPGGYRTAAHFESSPAPGGTSLSITATVPGGFQSRFKRFPVTIHWLGPLRAGPKSPGLPAALSWPGAFKPEPPWQARARRARPESTVTADGHRDGHCGHCDGVPSPGPGRAGRIRTGRRARRRAESLGPGPGH